MPDGEPRPATPKEQIELEVTIDKMFRASTRMFGIETPPHTGGGGGPGTWMFASLAQLDEVIAEWVTIRDTMDSRRRRIQAAGRLVTPPAADIMSGLQAAAFRRSLLALQQQAAEMYEYADGYVQRLQTARAAYAETEARTETRMKRPHG